MGFAPPPHDGLPMGDTRAPTLYEANQVYVWERTYRIDRTDVYLS